MKKKCGFTLLEAVVTLGVFGISISLVTLVMSSLVRVQNYAGDENVLNYNLQKIDSTVNRYISDISVVSLKDSSMHYSPTASLYADHSISFAYTKSESTLNYSMSYIDSNLVIHSDFDSSLDETVKLNQIDDIVFSYDSTIQLLLVKASANGVVNKFTYVVRVV